MRDQHEEQRTGGEFEKWLREQERARPASFDAPGWDWRHEQGARAARDWILNKARAICGDDYDPTGYHINIVELEKLEEACK